MYVLYNEVIGPTAIYLLIWLCSYRIYIQIYNKVQKICTVIYTKIVLDCNDKIKYEVYFSYFVSLCVGYF